MEEQNTPQKDDAQTSVPETIIIPPENPEKAEIPPEFASPALFQKEEEIQKEVSIDTEKTSHAKQFVLFGILFLVLAVGVVSIVQISLDRKFENVFISNDTTPLTLELSEEDESTTDPVETCGSPSVSIISPEENQIFLVGETATFSWELCGIGKNLIDSVEIDFYTPETNIKQGTFPVSCLTEAETFQNGTQSYLWNIPPFLEAETGTSLCAIPDLNFLEPYQYKLRVSYAGGQYKTESEFFVIDGTSYEYIPPQFSDYPAVVTPGFERAPFVDSSVPEFLQDALSPAYFEAPVLFAGFYRWYTIPNGPSFVIDLRDGKAYSAPATSGVISAIPTSFLYISEEELEEALEADQTHRIVWYVFDEATKDFEYITKRLCRLEGTGFQKNYVDCVPEL